MTNKILYKYKSLENFKYFVDIIHNNRLYAAVYTELNDPLEGIFLYKNGELDKAALEKLKIGKEQIRICSLSKTKRDNMMWAHYANGHKGVVLAIELDEHPFVDVKYDGPLSLQGCDKTPQEILSHKYKVTP